MYKARLSENDSFANKNILLQLYLIIQEWCFYFDLPLASFYALSGPSLTGGLLQGVCV